MIKFLNFGMTDPLTLGMGHPVVDRVSRLKTPSRPSGVIFAGLVSLAGLWVTAAASEPVLKSGDAMLKQEFRIKGFFADDPDINLDDERNYMIEVKDKKISIFAHSIITPKSSGDTDGDLEFMGSTFELMQQCAAHASKKMSVHYYRASMNKGLIVGPKGDYIIECRPGNDETRQILGKDDVRAAISKAPELSASDKTRLRSAFEARFAALD